jgi:hypothetical protein
MKQLSTRADRRALKTDLAAADVVPGLVPVAERPGGGVLGLELDEGEPAAVSRLPVPHHHGRAHLAEAGEVLDEVGLRRGGRDAPDEELAGLGRSRRRSSGCLSRSHRRRRARVLPARWRGRGCAGSGRDLC